MIFENKLDSVSSVEKTQKIRLWVDMVIIPAVLLSIAYRGNVTRLNKILLYGIAGATIGYNLKNYIKFKN